MCLCFQLKAQQADKLRIRTQSEALVLSPMVDFMVKGLPNHFQVSLGENWVLMQLDVQGGVLLADSASVIVVEPDEATEGQLELTFELKNFKSKETEEVTKKFHLLPPPQLYLNNTELDSVIYNKELIMNSNFVVKPEAYRVELYSADMSFISDTSVVQASYPFSPEDHRKWRAFVLESTFGNLIQLNNIRYEINGELLPRGGGAFYITDEAPEYIQVPQTVIRK